MTTSRSTQTLLMKVGPAQLHSTKPPTTVSWGNSWQLLWERCSTLHCWWSQPFLGTLPIQMWRCNERNITPWKG